MYKCASGLHYHKIKTPTKFFKGEYDLTNNTQQKPTTPNEIKGILKQCRTKQPARV